MATDARISAELPGHPKTKKLIKRLGAGAAWHLICLFLWAAANRSDGDLAGMTDEDIELAVDWMGENGKFIAELADIGFLDGEEGARSIHDWEIHNPWAAGAEMRSAKARWNSVKRHHGPAEADRQVPEYAAVRAAAGIPASNAGSTPDSTEFAASSNAADATRTENAATSNAPSPSHIPSHIPPPSPSPNTPPPPEGGDVAGLVLDASPPAKRKRKRNKNPTFDAALIDLPPWLGREHWLLWVQDRKTRGNPVSEAAAPLQLRSLAQYLEQGHSPQSVIEHSIASGYTGLYPPKTTTLPSKGRAPSSHGNFDSKDYHEGVTADGHLA